MTTVGMVLGLFILGGLFRAYMQSGLQVLLQTPWALKQLIEYNELRGERPLLVALFHSSWRCGVLLVGMTIVGIPLALLVAMVSRLRVIMAPVMRLLSLPWFVVVLLLLPLVFRGDESATLGSLAVVMGLSLVHQTQEAARTVPKIYIHSARALGADTWEVVRWTVWPLAKRHIFLAVARTISFSWGYVAVAEYVTAERGLGELIYSARQSAQMAHVWVSFSMVLGLSFVTYTVMHTMVVRLYPKEVVSE